MLLSVVVPVFNERENIPVFLGRVVPILSQLTADFEIIFVADPCKDGTEATVELEHAKDKRIKLLRLSRRFGQPKATFAGLCHASGDAAIVIDVDLQDPPELMLKMVAKWREGFDVVYAQRRSREGETALKRLVAYTGYRLINRLAEVSIPANTGDYRLLNRRAMDEVIRLKETHGFLRGLVALVGYKQTAIQFDRAPRHSGTGNYNRFFGSIRIGMNGVIGFSNGLLSLATLMGFAVAGMSFMTALVYFVLKLTGTPFPIGNPTLVIITLFLGGVQLISVGILGEYIGRIYEEVKRRPRFIVEQAVGLIPKSDQP